MAAPNLRTDLSIVQLPNTLPNVGGLLGKNTIITDPDFGTRIVRLTDGSSGSGNFSSMQTNDGPSNYQMWNTDDTLLACRNTNGSGFLFQFNPATMQGTQLGTAAPYKIQGAYVFSKVTPGIIYNAPAGGTVVNQLTYALISGVWTFQSTAVLCDFATILPGGFTVNWQSELTVSQGDTIFSLAFSTGHQDTGFNACLYKPGSGFRMLNSQTLAVTGTWGATGTATLANTSASNFFLHGVSTTPNATYTTLSPVGNAFGGSTFVWANATLLLTLTGIGGHHGLGYLFGYTGNPGGGQYDQFAYATPSSHVQVIPAQAGPPGLPANQNPKQVYKGDQHSAFSPISTTDASITWITNGLPPVFPFTSCWMGELRGLDGTGLVSGQQGIVYRACHTFNSGKSQEYIVANAQIGASQTGNFIAFASDWGGAGTIGPLGSTSGAPTGTIGTNARGDVFIVAIKTTAQAPAITSANSTTFTQGIFGSFTVNATGSPTPALSESGSLPSGVTFVDNGNGTATLSGTPGPSGTFAMTITAANGVLPNATQPFTLTVNSAATLPTITSANNVTFTQGVFGSFNVTTTGTPIPAISETGSLPSGVTFVDNGNRTATLSGTPTASGTFPLTISATNTAGTATQPFTLTVTAVVPPVAPTITSGNSATFTLGVFGSFTVTTTGTPTPSISKSGSLPGGVTFVDNGNGTATLSGTATASGSFPFTITAANGVLPNATQLFTLTITVTPVPPTITSANNTRFIAGVFGSFSINTTGTPTPSISAVVHGFPPGISFVDNGNGTATLSGTSSAIGKYAINITAHNGVLPNATQLFTLTISPPVSTGTVTGKFIYPNGTPIAGGLYQWKLSADSLNPSVAATVPQLIIGTLDSNGNLVTSMTFNDILQTVFGATTSYQLTIKAPNGGEVWNENYFLTGTAANLTLILPSGTKNAI